MCSLREVAIGLKQLKFTDASGINLGCGLVHTDDYTRGAENKCC